MNKEIAIRVTHLSKKYSIGKKKVNSLRGALAANFQSKDSKTDEFWALKDVSFEIKKGDVIGIIGKNGAGKSTLLKILSQITKPTTGRIEINGRVASLLEVGTGFHPELTGRENIYLNGTILGMSRKEVSSKFDDIVDFSGVEKFIDTPVKHYSSGMYVRLAFAVAAHLEPEILIIDEVLAVGDAEFQEKCLGKMKQVSEEGRTVIFVSHDIGAIQRLTNKSILFVNGELISFDETSEIVSLYRKSNFSHSYSYLNENMKNGISKVNIITSTGSYIHEFGKELKIEIEANFIEKYKNVALAIQIINEEGKSIINPLITEEKLDWIENGVGKVICQFNYPRLFLGIYTLNIHLGEKSSNVHIDSIENICSFKVTMDNVYSDYGWFKNSATYLETHSWQTIKEIYESTY